jgi:hypothetical protein
MIPFYCQLCGSRIVRMDINEDVEVFLHSFFFHQHVDYKSLKALKLLVLIRSISFSFSTIDNLLTLYFTFVISTLVYASVACSTLTTTKREKASEYSGIFLALSHNLSFQKSCIVT